MKESIISIILTTILLFTILTVDKTRTTSSNSFPSIDLPIIIIDLKREVVTNGMRLFLFLKSANYLSVVKVIALFRWVNVA